jgi:hypothetical protein
MPNYANRKEKENASKDKQEKRKKIHQFMEVSNDALIMQQESKIEERKTQHIR